MLEDIITTYCGIEVSPMDYYTDMFHLGENYIQRNENDTAKLANPIIVGLEDDGSEDGRIHRFILFEDTFEETLNSFNKYEWAIISGCTYWGRKNDAAHQSKCFALIFDLDYIDEETLNNLLSGAAGGLYPQPNYINLSGGGVHLVYIFEEPLPLFPNTKTQLKQLKYALTDLLWNRYTSTSYREIQHQGINQGFRTVGCKVKPKYGTGIVRSYRLNIHPVSIEYLNEYVPSECRVNTQQLFAETKITIEEAKQKYPNWYNRVVVNKENKGHWQCKPDLYNWWLRNWRQAKVGHRYFYVMSLAIYAAKCGITDYEKVKKDAMELIPYFNLAAPDHPFTEKDINSALECLDERYCTFPRDDISKISGIEIKKNKRNHRAQPVHLERARAVEKIDYPNNEWQYHGGAPTKQSRVEEWQRNHPNGNKSQCAKDTGLSRTTVIKWWE